MTFWGPDFDELERVDPEIAGVVVDELSRLRSGLQLIASENFTSPAVLAALGSTLSNKYAEGYPGKRYYGGCEVVDVAEQIGIDRAKQLFGADHANLQPHSGASANLAVYGAFLQPGDTVLAMSLPHGGHLTHGTKVSFSGKWFNAVHYGVAQGTEDIDYDQMRSLAREHRPKMIIAGGSAIPRLIDFAAFREVADEVGAVFMVDAAHFIGLVAGKAIPSPVPYADVVTFTTHKVLRGPRGGAFVCTAEHAAKLDKAVFPMMQGGPLMHAVAAKAVNFKECMTPEYQAYTRQVIANAQALTESLAAEGMRPVTGGTDTHLALLDLQGTGVTGKDAEARCDRAGIVLNKNAIPYDPQPASIASGVRVGTPSVTTQGMTEGDMKEIGSLIGRAVRDADGADAEDVRRAVTALVQAHPAYGRPEPGPGDQRVDRLGQPQSQLASAPVREYLLVLCVAAGVTYLLTPVARRLAVLFGAMAQPRDRDVHAIPTPRLGGMAIYAGVCAGFLLASSLPALSRVFLYSDVEAVVVAGGLIVLLGIADDRWGIDALTKLAGQVLAAGVMVLLGLELLTITLPGVGAVSLGPESVPLTIVLALLTVNAINFIDGLDGLAAGVGAIAALAFFAFSYSLASGTLTSGIAQDRITAPALIAVVLAGACLGFLPHNFNPARIFMGDSGSMLIGLMLAAAVTSLTGQVSYANLPPSAGLPVLLPLLLPFAVLAVPFVDLALAVVRRTRAGRSPFAPDKAHLHHRLLEIGHSHTRAVLIMYCWTALLAFAFVAVSLWGGPLQVVAVIGAATAVALVVSSVPRLRAAAREKDTG